MLIAPLIPSMDKAIYQATLAVCGANLKGIAGGANTYAIASSIYNGDENSGTSDLRPVIT